MFSTLKKNALPYVAAVVAALISILVLSSSGSHAPRAQAAPLSAAPAAVTTHAAIAKPAAAPKAHTLSAHQRHLLHQRKVASHRHRVSSTMRTVHGKHYLSGVVLSRYHKPPMIKTRWGLVPKNTYHGKWYDASALSTRNCIVRRESDGSPTSINSAGYSGLYQFGLSWTRTLQKFTGEHVAIVRMSYQAQDLAFWRVWDFGRGASNWAGGRWSCPRV